MMQDKFGDQTCWIADLITARQRPDPATAAQLIILRDGKCDFPDLIKCLQSINHDLI